MSIVEQENSLSQRDNGSDCNDGDDDNDDDSLSDELTSLRDSLRVIAESRRPQKPLPKLPCSTSQEVNADDDVGDGDDHVDTVDVDIQDDVGEDAEAEEAEAEAEEDVVLYQLVDEDPPSDDDNGHVTAAADHPKEELLSPRKTRSLKMRLSSKKHRSGEKSHERRAVADAAGRRPAAASRLSLSLSAKLKMRRRGGAATNSANNPANSGKGKASPVTVNVAAPMQQESAVSVEQREAQERFSQELVKLQNSMEMDDAVFLVNTRFNLLAKLAMHNSSSNSDQMDVVVRMREEVEAYQHSHSESVGDDEPEVKLREVSSSSSSAVSTTQSSDSADEFTQQFNRELASLRKGVTRGDPPFKIRSRFTLLSKLASHLQGARDAEVEKMKALVESYEEQYCSYRDKDFEYPEI